MGAQGGWTPADTQVTGSTTESSGAQGDAGGGGDTRGCVARLFALGRMVEVLLSNLHRLHDLWAIFLEHIVEALGDSRPSIRAASLEGLSKAIGGVLASVVATSAHRRQSISTPGKPGSIPGSSASQRHAQSL